MKANEKSFDEAMQISLKKRAEKDSQKVTALLEEKIEIQTNLLQIVEQHQQRLLKEVYKPLELVLDANYAAREGPFADIPDPVFPATKKATATRMKQAQATDVLASSSSAGSIVDAANDNLKLGEDVSLLRSSVNSSPRPPLLTLSSEQATAQSNSLKVSPRKRVSLEDEPPVDPNEPVYCYCKQVSWGEMVACDNSTCPREWFHLACVNLSAPPTGKWFCNECKSETIKTSNNNSSSTK